MRILIYGLNFAPELTGIGKYTGELAEYLVEQGHFVRVVTAPPYYPQWRISQGYSSFYYQHETYNEIDVYRCPIWVPQDQTVLNRIFHLISFALSSAPVAVSQIVWKPDVVLTVVPALFSAPVGLLTARIAGAKSWLHIQDFEIDAALGLGMLSTGKLFHKWLRLLETWLYRRFDCVSTISTRMIEHLWEKGVSKGKTSLLPNWIDCQSIFPLSGSNSYREVMDFADDEIVVQYAGNMGAKHGLELLIESSRFLQEETHIQFVLCGDGAVREELQEQAKGMPNVHFMPLQPQERLNELLNFADIHVLPQRTDAADLVMPSKLAGMMASGKPVIATANSGTQVARVVDGAGLVVSPENSEALTKAIKLLADDLDLREKLGTKGRAYAVQHWGKEKVLADFYTQLEQLIV